MPEECSGATWAPRPISVFRLDADWMTVGVLRDSDASQRRVGILGNPPPIDGDPVTEPGNGGGIRMFNEGSVGAVLVGQAGDGRRDLRGRG